MGRLHLVQSTVWTRHRLVDAQGRRIEPGGVTVCLVPARTDTAWWNDWVVGHATEVRFIRGRLKFGDSGNSAPFPSAIVVYDKRPKRYWKVSC